MQLIRAVINAFLQMTSLKLILRILILWILISSTSSVCFLWVPSTHMCFCGEIRKMMCTCLLKRELCLEVWDYWFRMIHSMYNYFRYLLQCQYWKFLCTLYHWGWKFSLSLFCDTIMKLHVYCSCRKKKKKKKQQRRLLIYCYMQGSH